MTTFLDYELLLQKERERNKELEQRVIELTAALEKLQEEQMRMQMKMQLEAALHAKERQQWQEDRQRRSVSVPSSPQRPIRIRSMQLKLVRPKTVKCALRSPGSTVRSLLSLPEAMRQHVQEHVHKKQQLYVSVIENQKTAAATEQTTRAFQERLHISEPDNVMDFNNQNTLAFSQLSVQQPSPSVCEDEHKRKLMQQRLKSYLHTQTCRPPEDDRALYGANKPWNCGQLHCATMRKVLVHMDSCTGGMDCAVPLCSSTREVIEHWRCCVDEECPVCRPAKQSLRVHTEVLAKTLEALNEGMDVAAAIDESTAASSSTFSLPLVANPARRVPFTRLHRAFRRTVESEAESDVGA